MIHRTPSVGRVWAACALILLAVPVFGDTPDDLLKVGTQAFRDGQYSLAVTSFQRICDEFPESPRAEEGEYLLGVSLFYAGRGEDALAALLAFRLHHPRSSLLPRAAYWTGAVYLKLGNASAALGYLMESGRNARETHPYKLDALLLTGVAQEALGRDADASASYRALLSDPEAGTRIPEATFRLAGTEYRTGRYAAARDLYGAILLKHTDSPFVRDAVFFLGESERALGSFTGAEKRYRTLLSLYPDSPYVEAASFRLVELSWRKKKASETISQLDVFLARFPGGSFRGSALRLKADILFSQKSLDAAVEAYARAVEALPDGTEKQSACYSMGLAQDSLGRTTDAVESFENAGHGGLADIAEKAGFRRAALLAGAGMRPEAIEALRAFLRDFPESRRAEEARRMLASLLEAQGERESSRAQWDAIIASFPGSARMPEYLYRRGTALLSLGRSPAALDDFQRVVRDYPRSPWREASAYSIGYAYAARGEYPRALPFFQSIESNRSRLSLAICLFDMGNFPRALAGFRSLEAQDLEEASRGAIALYAGRALYRMERLSEAAQQFWMAADMLESEKAASGAEARYWLGWSLLRLHRPAEARVAFLALAEGSPSSPRRQEALYRAAVSSAMLRDDGAAVALFDRVLAAPDASSRADIREQALYERGWALWRLSRAQESADSFETLAREFPSGRLAAQAFFTRAEQSFDAGRYEAAHAGFRRVASDFPRSPFAVQALYWSAESIRRAGDAAAAANGFWACLAASPASGLRASAIEGMTAALRAADDLDLARRFADKARAFQGMPADAAAGILLCYADMLLSSTPAESLAVIDEVRRAAPPEPFAGQASLLLGRYYGSQSLWDRALEVFGALERSRADEIGAMAALARGRTLEAMGRTSDAVDELLKVSYLFPDYSELAAEGLFNAARVARLRGEGARAAAIEETLRKAYPKSPWIASLDAR